MRADPSILRILSGSKTTPVAWAWCLQGVPRSLTVVFGHVCPRPQASSRAYRCITQLAPGNCTVGGVPPPDGGLGEGLGLGFGLDALGFVGVLFGAGTAGLSAFGGDLVDGALLTGARSGALASGGAAGSAALVEALSAAAPLVGSRTSDGGSAGLGSRAVSITAVEEPATGSWTTALLGTRVGVSLR